MSTPPRNGSDPGAVAAATRANENPPTHREIFDVNHDSNHTPAVGIDVRCADCGKRLSGWSYRPMFVQCDGCAEAEQSAQRNAQDQIILARAEMAENAERKASAVYDRISADVEQAGLPVPELADLSGLGLHHLSAVLCGDGELTVTQLLLLATALGVRAGAWFE